MSIIEFAVLNLQSCMLGVIFYVHWTAVLEVCSVHWPIFSVDRLMVIVMA